ncbi:MAG: Ig-like domain-containing protein [Pseudomonadota bacterium]
MSVAHRLARRAVFGALLFLSLGLKAEVAARYDVNANAVVVCCFQATTVLSTEIESGEIQLRHASSATGRSMLFTATRNADVLRLSPRFRLKAGEEYVVGVNMSSMEAPVFARFTIDKRENSSPRVLSVSPTAAQIPENTLRLYLTFSEPMARGQARDKIRIENSAGQTIADPFLNLATELWDNSQRRLTLLLDPGRLKRGVGPNVRAGTPLNGNQTYTLIVSGLMESAEGVEIGKDESKIIHVHTAERRAISPQRWHIESPPSNSKSSLTVTFDRIMDAGMLPRMIQLVDAHGERVDGHVSINDRQWTLAPKRPWSAGPYQLLVDSQIEDIAGNSLHAAFDSKRVNFINSGSINTPDGLFAVRQIRIQ